MNGSQYFLGINLCGFSVKEIQFGARGHRSEKTWYPSGEPYSKLLSTVVGSYSWILIPKSVENNPNSNIYNW